MRKGKGAVRGRVGAGARALAPQAAAGRCGTRACLVKAAKAVRPGGHGFGAAQPCPPSLFPLDPRQQNLPVGFPTERKPHQLPLPHPQPPPSPPQGAACDPGRAGAAACLLGAAFAALAPIQARPYARYNAPNRQPPAHLGDTGTPDVKGHPSVLLVWQVLALKGRAGQGSGFRQPGVGVEGLASAPCAAHACAAMAHVCAVVHARTHALSRAGTHRPHTCAQRQRVGGSPLAVRGSQGGNRCR